VFSVYLLELIHAADPTVFSPAALRPARAAGTIRAGPDGALTASSPMRGDRSSSRGLLAAAAPPTVPARRRGRPLAGARTGPRRSVGGRLLRVHGRLADGRFPSSRACTPDSMPPSPTSTPR
jgi:hypothetical protein